MNFRMPPNLSLPELVYMVREIEASRARTAPVAWISDLGRVISHATKLDWDASGLATGMFSPLYAAPPVPVTVTEEMTRDEIARLTDGLVVATQALAVAEKWPTKHYNRLYLKEHAKRAARILGDLSVLKVNSNYSNPAWMTENYDEAVAEESARQARLTSDPSR